MSSRLHVGKSESQIEDERDDDDVEDMESEEVDEEDDAEVETTAPGELDGLPVLAAIQLLGETGAGVEELQREIDAAGAGHHPRGVIWAVLMGLVEAGKIRQEGADEADSHFWIAASQDPKAVLARRMAIVLTVLRAESDEGWPLGDLITDAGFEKDANRAEADILALAAAGVLSTNEENGGTYYGLVQETMDRVEQLGVGLVIRAAFDLPDPATSAPADRSQFERAALEKAELASARVGELQTTINTMRDNLRRADLNPDWFLTAPPPAMPPQEETEFTERRVVDAAEKGVILMEIIALDRKLAARQAEFLIVKDEHKAKIGELEKEIVELESAAESNARTVVIPENANAFETGCTRFLCVDRLERRVPTLGSGRSTPEALHCRTFEQTLTRSLSTASG